MANILNVSSNKDITNLAEALPHGRQWLLFLFLHPHPEPLGSVNVRYDLNVSTPTKVHTADHLLEVYS